MSPIDKLAQKLIYHSHLYYNHPGHPANVSDEIYDNWRLELQQLDPHHPVLKQVGAPPEGRVVNHQHPMLSLEKALTVAEAQKCFQRQAEQSWLMSYKLDGMAVSLTYKNGYLQQAATRGRAGLGTDVTANILALDTIPNYCAILDVFDSIVIRGEVVMPKQKFEQLTSQQNLDYSSPRNLATGTLLHADPDLMRERELSFVAYDIFEDGDFYGQHWQRELERDFEGKLIFLSELGFTISPYKIITPAISGHSSKLEQLYQQAIQEKEHYEYDIDGLVFRLLDGELAYRLGENSHHPKYSFALKFPTTTVKTKVTHIDWSMSRRGTLTPVAVFEAVEVAGATLQRVNVTNLNELKRLNLAPGTEIWVKRSGEVIPYIERAEERADGDETAWQKNIIEHCPYCGSSVEKVTTKNTTTLKCSNNNCPQTQTQRIKHFLNQLEIKNWGEKLLYEYCQHEPVDLWLFVTTLTVAKVQTAITSRNISTSYAQKLVTPIQNLPQAGYNWSQFLPALGLERANSTGRKIGPEVQQLADLKNPELWLAHGLAPAYWPQLAADLRERWSEISALAKYLNIQNPVSNNSKQNETELIFNNQSFVITGKLKQARKHYESIIEKLGGKINSSVSKNTNYLLSGEKAGSKLTKAQQLGITIISEDDFQQLISNNK